MVSSPFRRVVEAGISARDSLAGALASASCRRISSASHQVGSAVPVCYLTGAFPDDPLLSQNSATGGAVKLAVLARAFPHSFPECALLYRVSSVAHPASLAVVRAARAARIPVVTNQNGVVYPAWFTPGWLSGDARFYNGRAARLLKLSSFVIYQSTFCKEASDEFLGKVDLPQQVILNPVDTERFSPPTATAAADGPPIIVCVWGGGYRKGRTLASVAALIELIKGGVLVRLRFIGVTTATLGDQALRQECIDACLKSGVDAQALEFLPLYTRAEAPALFRDASLLLHLAQNDPSPNVLGEAMACGLPVVYQRSGGCEEIVGEAGIGLSVPRSWEREIYPRPDAVAEGVNAALERRLELSKLARARALAVLSAQRFIQQHEEIFRALTDE